MTTDDIHGTSSKVEGGFEAGVSALPQPDVEVSPDAAVLQDLLKRIGSVEQQDLQAALADLDAQAAATRGADIGGLLQGLAGQATQQTGAAAKPDGSEISAALKRIAEALGLPPAVVAQLAPTLRKLLAGGSSKAKAKSKPKATAKPKAKPKPKAAAKAKAKAKSKPKAPAKPKAKTKPKAAAKARAKPKPKATAKLKAKP